jgi:hypothetical protein
VFLHDLEGADRILRAMTTPATGWESRSLGFHMRAMAAMGRGQWRAALAFCDSAAAGDSAAARIIRAWYLALPFAPELTPERNDLKARLARDDFVRMRPRVAFESTVPPHAPALAPFLLGVLALRDGDGTSARHALDALRAARFPDSLQSLHRGYVALFEALRDTWRPAPGHTAPAPSVGIQELPNGEGFGGLIYTRTTLTFLAATNLERAGRGREALTWFRSLDQTRLSDAPFSGPALEAMARITRALGDRDGERDALRRLVILWNECDLELRPHVDAARARLAELARG